MDFLLGLSPEEIIALSNILSVNISRDYNITELAVIANFFMLLGENIETFLRVQANLEFLQQENTNIDTIDN